MLVGEEDKFVALSPQRIVAAHTTMDATDPDASDAMVESEVQSGGGLHFTIIGAQNETVAITVVAPSSENTVDDDSDDDSHGRAMDKAMAGKIVVVTTTLGSRGEAAVSCSAGVCQAAPA